MSNKDERIVQMTFDNKKFESNARTTMDTLDKLNKKLSFDDTIDRLKEMQKTSDTFKLDNINNNLQRLADFTTIPGRMFAKLFDDIASKAVETGEKLFTALTITPRMEGFAEYENKIQSIQVIAANTGVLMRDLEQQGSEVYDWTADEIQAANDIWEKGMYGNGVDRINNLTAANYDYARVQSKVNDIVYQFSREGEDCDLTIEDIEAAIDDLNKYADDTIYNFAQMTQAVGTFTTAGVEFNESVTDVKGIANLAALVGAPAADASRAMFQLSQGLSVGSIRLMDWMSIEHTAGMGGKIFQDSLKETARVHGVAVDEIIEANGSFRESLREGWLTADVLNETLAKFSGDYDEDYWRSLGYTEEEVQNIIRLGQVAVDSATKIRTFTQLKDASKEALASTWTKTWEILIGDFYEAPKLLTRIGNAFQEIVEPIGTLRNAILGMWSSLGGREYLIEGLANIFHVLKNIISNVAEGIYAAFGSPSAYNIARVLTTITKAFYDFTAVLRYGTEYLPSFQHILTATFTIGRIVVDAFKEAISTVVDIIKEVVSWFSKSNEETDEASSSIETATEKVENYSKKLYDFTKAAEIFKKAHDNILKVVRKIPKAFAAIVSGVSIAMHTIGDFFTALFNKFEEKTGIDIIETLKNIGWAILGLISILVDGVMHLNMETVVDFIFAIPSLIVEGFTKIKDGIIGAKDGVEKAGTEVGDTFSKIFGFLSDVFSPFAKVLDGLKTIIRTIGEYIKEYGLTGVFSVLASGSVIGAMLKIRQAFSEFGGVLKSWKKLGGGFLGVLRGLKDVLVAYSFEISAKALKTVAVAVAILTASIWALSLLEKSKVENAAASISLLLTTLIGVIKFSTNIGKLFGISVALIAMAAAINALTIVALLLAFLPEEKLKNGLTSLGEILTIFVLAFKGLMSVSKNVKAKEILAISVALFAFALALNMMIVPLLILSFLPAEKINNGLVQLAKVMGLVALAMVGVGLILVGFKKLLEGTTKALVGDQKQHTYVLQLIAAFIGFSVAVLILTAALIAISLVPEDKIETGIVGLITVIASAIAIMAVMTIAIALIMKSIEGVDPKSIRNLSLMLGVFAVVLAVFAASLVLVALATKVLGKDTMIVTVIALAAMMLTMAEAIKIMSKSDADTKKLVGFMLAFSITIGVLAAAIFKFSSIPFGKLVVGVGTMIVVLVALVTVMWAMQKIIHKLKGKVLLTLAYALTAFAAVLIATGLAMKFMASAVKELSGAGVEGILTVLVSLLIIFGALVALVWVVTNAGPNAAAGLKNLALALAGFAAVIFAISSAIKWLTKLIQTMILLSHTDMSGLSTSLADTLDAIIDNMDRFKELVDAFVEIVGTAVGSFLNRQFIMWIAMIKAWAKPFVEAIAHVLNVIEEYVPDIVESCMNILIAIVDGIDAKIDDLVDSLGWLLVDTLDALGDWLIINDERISESIRKVIVGVLDVVWRVIYGLLKPGIDYLVDNFLGPAFMWISDAISNAVDTILDLPNKIKNFFKDRIDDFRVGWRSVKQWFKDKIVGFKESSVGKALSAAFDFIKKPFEAVGDALKAVIDAIKGFIEDIKEAWNDLDGYFNQNWGDFWDSWAVGLGINSPSKIAKEDGEYVVEGFKIGLGDTGNTINKAVNNLTDKAKKTFDENKGGLFNMDGIADKVKEQMGDIGGALDMSSLGADFGSITPVMDTSSFGMNKDSIFGDMKGSMDMGMNIDENMTYTKDISSNVQTISDDSAERITASINSLGNRIAEMAEEIKRLKVQMDTGALVGELVDPMDEALGAKAAARNRGV